MIYFFVLLFCFLLAGNYAILKNLLYPPALFVSVWLLSFIGLILSGDTLYSVSFETLIVYFYGAIAFSIGGLAVIVLRKPAKIATHVSFTPMRQAKIHRILDIVLFVIVIGLPFYWQYVTADVDFFDPLYFSTQRVLSVQASESSQRIFNPLNNLVVLSMFLAMALHFENDGTFSRKWRAYLAILLALLYGGLTGTKGNMVILLLTLAFISSIRSRKINFIALGGVMVLVLSMFASMLLLVNYVYIDAKISFETFRLIAVTVQNYWLGGLVAFNQIVEAPLSLASNQNLNRFFLETANSFGASFSLPSIHADYTPISPSQDTNVYTIYFSYFKDHGWLGVILGMSLLGGVLTWIYGRGRRGNPLAMAFYGINAAGIVLSVHAEHFVLGLNLYIKMLIFFYLVYYGFARLSFGKRPHLGGRRSA